MLNYICFTFISCIDGLGIYRPDIDIVCMCVCTEWWTPVHDESVPPPADVQPLQHHRPHRGQGVRHGPVLLHDAQDLQQGDDTITITIQCMYIVQLVLCCTCTHCTVLYCSGTWSPWCVLVVGWSDFCNTKNWGTFHVVIDCFFALDWCFFTLFRASENVGFKTKISTKKLYFDFFKGYTRNKMCSLFI